MQFAYHLSLQLRHNVSFAGQLHIAESEETDQGKYECVAENEVGTQYSYSAQLYVRGKQLSRFL